MHNFVLLGRKHLNSSLDTFALLLPVQCFVWQIFFAGDAFDLLGQILIGGMPPEPVDSQISGNGVYPGRDATLLRDEKMRFPPNGEERFLGNIFRGSRICSLPHHHRFNARPVEPEEILESQRVAIPRYPLEKIVHTQINGKNAGTRQTLSAKYHAGVCADGLVRAAVSALPAIGARPESGNGQSTRFISSRK
jgi:hypothetical protein